MPYCTVLVPATFALFLSIQDLIQPLLAFDSSRNTWHRRLCHSRAKVLDILRKNKFIIVQFFMIIVLLVQLVNLSHLPFQLIEHSSVSPLQLIHFYIWQSPVISHLGFRYYVVFVDNYSCFIWFYPMKEKKNEIYTFLTKFQTHGSKAICAIH